MREKMVSAQYGALYAAVNQISTHVNTLLPTENTLSAGALSALKTVAFATVAYNAEDPMVQNISTLCALLHGAYTVGYYAGCWSSDATSQQLKSLTATAETTFGRMGRELSLGSFFLSGGLPNPTIKTAAYPCTIGFLMSHAARAGLKKGQAATTVHNAHNAGKLEPATQGLSIK